jgi:trk system potassium uptake protein TrkH
MTEFLDKLTAVMFYSSIPLLIPFFYSIVIGDGGWMPIGLTIAIMALPAVPSLAISFAANVVGMIGSLIRRDTPFNYARIISMEPIRKQVEVLTFGEIMVLTSLAWIIVPALSILPYAYYGIPVVEALFESFSGWTSTGLSALETVSALPPSVVLFRSTTQWIGGLGIIVLILSTFRGKEAVGFLKAEGRNKTELGIASTVSLIFRVYLVLTIIGIIMLWASGFGILESVSLSFSGISNGGFFPFDSFQFTDMQKIMLALLMFAGATNFLFYQSLWQGLLDKAIFDEEFVFYVLLTALAVTLIVSVGSEELFNSVMNSVSAIATGGFTIGDLSVMHQFAIYLLVILMLSGGMVGSTTGGIKLWRILVIAKSLANQVRESFLPSGSVQMVKINGLPINDKLVIESAVFVFAYILIFLAGSSAFLAAGYDIEKAIFITASALGNVGLSTLDVPSVGQAGKVFLIVLMYVGRIEIFPILAMASYFLRR